MRVVAAILGVLVISLLCYSIGLTGLEALITDLVEGR